MISWKIAKCKYTKEFTDGTLKRVTEPYLVNAMSITEAEARIYKEVGEYVRGEFVVTSISGVNYADIFAYDDTEKWYHVQMAFTTEDADSGREKLFKNNYLVNAHNIKEAYERTEESLKGLMASYEILVIKTSPIIDIFPFDPDAVADTGDKSEGEKVNSPNINVAYASGEDEEA